MTAPFVLRRSSLLTAFLLASAVASSSTHGQGPIRFCDVTKETTIDFRHTDGSTGERYIVESMTAGLNLFDYDGDGDVDIYFLSGAPLPGGDTGVLPHNVLYRNDGGWKFTDVTREAGVGDTGFALGVADADYDNDGDRDLYLNNFGPNVLYRNNGDGTFTDVTDQAGVSNGHKVGAGVGFLDADSDGDLDLYVANYVDFTCNSHIPCWNKGLPWYNGAKAYDPEPDTLFRNNGDGTFTDVSEESGLAAHAGAGMGLVCADYDDDRDTDVFVCNDGMANFLFENDGTGHFAEVALFAGVAYNLDGRSEANMGVSCADFDNDGRLDFFSTNYQGELTVLYRNLGDGFFEDATLKSGAGAGTLPHVTWGVGLVDFDNDGDRDAFIACGHLQDNVALVDRSTSYHARNVLLMNRGNGQFVDVSNECGDGLSVKLSSRGVGFDDLDNDGDIDVVVLNSRREPTVLRNDSQTGNHWLQVCLQGVKGNRDGVGARVIVVADNLTQLDEVHSGRGYQSNYGARLHFGLGTRNHVDRIEVRWIGGHVDVVENVAANQLVTIVQGQGISPGKERGNH